MNNMNNMNNMKDIELYVEPPYEDDKIYDIEYEKKIILIKLFNNINKKNTNKKISSFDRIKIIASRQKSEKNLNKIYKLNCKRRNSI